MLAIKVKLFCQALHISERHFTLLPYLLERIESYSTLTEDRKKKDTDSERVSLTILVSRPVAVFKGRGEAKLLVCRQRGSYCF